MGMSLGRWPRLTLFGESHGIGVGVLIEGLPPGMEVDLDAMVADLERRRPGRLLVPAAGDDGTASRVSALPGTPCGDETVAVYDCIVTAAAAAADDDDFNQSGNTP